MADNLVHSAVIERTGIPTIKRTLDLASLRQKITAGNVANAQSPGYRRRAVNFAAELKRLVQPDRLAGVRTHPEHLPIGETPHGPFKVRIETGRSAGAINNVDVEQEMAALAESQVWYQLGTTLTRKKFSGLRLAIRGER
jgi:flagellar basal-body rod protein FlgB